MREIKTLSDVQDICEKIGDILYFYYCEKSFRNPFEPDKEPIANLNNSSQYLVFSNGDKINLKFYANHLAHLLGVNTIYLSSLGYYRETNSYDILKRMCNDAYKLWENDVIGNSDLKKVFSPYIFEKLEAFKYNTYLSVNNIECVCKYDEKRTYGILPDSEKMDYLIISKVNDKYYVLTLKKVDNYYAPVSNQMYNSYEEVIDKYGKLLVGQELLTCGFKKVYSNYTERPFFVYNEEKIQKLKTFKKWCDDLQCTPNVFRDFEYLMSKSTERKELSQTLTSIADDMKKGKLVEADPFLSEDIKTLVNAHNDSLVNSDSKEFDKAYSEKEEENRRLNKELEDTIRKYDLKEVELSMAKDENESLKEKLERYMDMFEKVKQDLGII